MKNLTTKKLIEQLNKLYNDFEMACQMISSGEFRNKIWKDYEPQIEEIEVELKLRGININ